MKKSICQLKTLVVAFILSLLLCIPSANLWAHGVDWILSSKKTYGVEFTYDDESPMAYAEVKIFGPNDSTKLSQTGRTDKNGYFAFIPDADGQWLMAADDGAGHLAKAELSVSLAAASGGAADISGAPAVSSVNLDREIAKATKPMKIGLVISIFLNLALISMIVKRKKPAQ